MPQHELPLKDFMDRDLHLDDMVLSTWNDGNKLFRMKVVGFTKQQIRLELLDDITVDKYYGTLVKHKAGDIITRYPVSVALVKTYDGRQLGY